MGIFFAENRNLLAFIDKEVLRDVARFVFLDDGADLILLPATMGGVVLEKIGEGAGIDQVVDRDNLKSAHFVGAAESETANPSESVDCKFDGHCFLSPPY